MREDKYFHISLINNFGKQYILTYKNMNTPKIKVFIWKKKKYNV
jgi:hypothetical protein